MAKADKEQKIPLDAVPGRPKKYKTKNKYWSRKPKPEISRDKLLDLMIELAKRL